MKYDDSNVTKPYIRNMHDTLAINYSLLLVILSGRGLQGKFRGGGTSQQIMK